MRVIRTLFAGLTLIGTLLGAGSMPALAQSSADLTDTDHFTFVSPDGCVAEPANLDRVKEIALGPDATPVSFDELSSLYESDEVVSGEDAEAVRTLLHTMVSCINADDPLRFLTLFSDDFYRSYAEAIEGIFEDAESQDLTTEREPLDDGYAIVQESDVFALEDGRLIYSVAAAWVTPGPLETRPEPEEVLQIAAAEIDGVWLIDALRVMPYEMRGDGPDCGEACATPASTFDVEAEGYAGWIMPAQIAEENETAFVWGVEVTGFFEPSEAEIAEAEAALIPFLEPDERANESGLLESIGGHLRQYFGYETEAGRLVAVNGFCNSFNTDPATQVIFVEDGGACFWHGVYNLDTHEWERVSINGDA